MFFDVVLDHVDLDDVLPQCIVLDVCDLRVFIFFLGQVADMIVFHLLDDLYESVVERSGQVDLVGVVLFDFAEFLDVGGVLGDHLIAEFKDIDGLLIYWFVLVLGVVRYGISGAKP